MRLAVDAVREIERKRASVIAHGVAAPERQVPQSAGAVATKVDVDRSHKRVGREIEGVDLTVYAGGVTEVSDQEIAAEAPKAHWRQGEASGPPTIVF